MSITNVRSALTSGTRLTVLAASSALLLSSLAAPSALAVSESTPAGAAAAYLLRDAQAHGGHLIGEFGGQTFDDIGLNIDAAFGLAAGGATKEESATLLDYTTSHLAEYANQGAGQAGKALAYAALIGADPHNVNGVDLLAKLQQLRQDNGSYKVSATKTNTADAINQAWIVLGLYRAGELSGGSANPAVTYLASLQCADGGFKGWDGACGGDPDYAGMATQVLAAVGDTAAATKGAQFLASKQLAGGGFDTPWNPGAPNSNSTALAANAFTAVNDQANVGEAVAFLKTLQFGSQAAQPVRGAVANVAEDLNTTTTSNDSLRRSTTQSVVALAGQTLASAKFGAAPVTPDTPSTPGTTQGSNGSSQGNTNGSSTVGIVALILGLIGAIAAGFFALNPQLLPRL